MGDVLLVGSANKKKAAELSALLQGTRWEVRGLGDYPAVSEPEETGTTFEENAVLKARYYSEAFGVACLADDSGLVVDALGGAPGVYSARYAGPDATDADNNEKLLAAMEEYMWHERTARFVCHAAFCQPGQPIHLEYGVVEGHISMEPFGPGGFGYDPLFVPQGYECTFGEMSAADKHGLSHRGQAMGKIRAYLESLA
jgi:XTP/dITP diphosphohydrolase